MRWGVLDTFWCFKLKSRLGVRELSKRGGVGLKFDTQPYFLDFGGGLQSGGGEGAIQTPNPPDNSSNVFRHGQWYIALSCFTWKINVFVKILDSEGQLRTTNQRIS